MKSIILQPILARVFEVLGSEIDNTPSTGEQFRVFGKIGVLSFGGPAAQIALMHKMLVEETGWLKERQFMNALSFCMLLPGPEAMQLATYSGWRLSGIKGGLLAGLLFVLPGAAVIFALASLYVLYGNLPVTSALFLGVKAAVLIVVIEALLRVSKKALYERAHWALAGLSFIGIFFLAVPFPVIIFLAAAYGFFLSTRDARAFDVELPQRVPLSQTALVLLVGLAVWFVPIWVLDQVLGQDFLGQLGRFFSTLAVVTFGGAYAVLAYMAQDVVAQFGWLTAAQMMDGLGLAETTPGPLILVTQFVGFLAAYGQSGLGYAFMGGLVALWATFIPCFIWIFAGAPYIEWISAQPRLKEALSAITAAVVGVMLNLSIWFALHVFFAKVDHVEGAVFNFWLPQWDSFLWPVAVLSVVAGVLLFVLHRGLATVLTISALGGLAFSYIA